MPPTADRRVRFLGAFADDVENAIAAIRLPLSDRAVSPTCLTRSLPSFREPHHARPHSFKHPTDARHVRRQRARDARPRRENRVGAVRAEDGEEDGDRLRGRTVHRSKRAGVDANRRSSRVGDF
jgi:hypothetical protein